MIWNRQRRPGAPCIATGHRIYAVGDIHGRLDLLNAALGRILADIGHGDRCLATTFVFLGDYVDRGPDSAGVVERLVLLAQEVPTVCLKGNHEGFLLNFLNTPETLQDWGESGGFNTLLSYGLASPLHPSVAQCTELAAAFRNALPQSHLTFLQSLSAKFVQDDYCFVHAGLRPQVPLEQQTEHDLLSIRTDFLSSKRVHEKYIIHGHTPVREPHVLFNRLNIDTGAYATNKLTCLVLEGETRRFL